MKPITSFNKIKKGAVLARDLVSFVVPKKEAGKKNKKSIFEKKKIVVVVPTYKPSSLTHQLVRNLHDWHCNVEIVIVDDSNSKSSGWQKKMFEKLELFSRNKRVHFVKTPKNLHKPGALNYGFKYVKETFLTVKPNVIVTTDDDVIMTEKTLPVLINKLYSSPKTGAVCSLVRVKNKNKNLLTKLQGLEYHNFNITKISDNGFFKGPLVMQGATTAFRYSSFNQVGGYAENNLIEDYEITANLKKHGWNVAFSPDCWIWTEVPENFSTLWKQRVRWTYWGIVVIENYYKSLTSVLQDVIGHASFLGLFFLIMLSFLISSPTSVQGLLINIIVAVALSQVIMSFIFSLYILKYYKDVDWKDYLIRLLIVPEFFYSNILTLVLLGSYPFFIFNKIFGQALKVEPVYKLGLKFFNWFGYSLSWGTRKLEGGEVNG